MENKRFKTTSHSRNIEQVMTGGS